MRKADLIKFIASQASSAEEEEVLEWVNKSPGNRDYFNRLRNIWILSSLPDERATEEEYRDFMTRHPVGKNKKNKNIYLLSFAALAACLVLFFMVVKPHLGNDTAYSVFYANHFSNTTGDIRFHTLPDGSKVALYPGSKLSYKDNFPADRETFLNGRAFFEVSSDEFHPLYVRTPGNTTIKVTGTKFFVKSIPGTEDSHTRFEASLFKGTIAVIDGKTKNEINMLPGDRVIAESDGDLIKLKQEDTQPEYLAELESYFNFENTKMEDVIRKLEEYYNVTFQLEKKEIGGYLFTANIREQSLESVLKLFYRTMGIKSRHGDSSTIILY